MVEFTVVFPVVILVAFGTVDATYLMWEWAQANKAVYVGARIAATSDPVASGINNLVIPDPLRIGESCANAADGTATGACPTATAVCTPAASGGACTGGFAFDNNAFQRMFAAAGSGDVRGMQWAFPRLQRQNVQITYQTNGLGFAGMPAGTYPMNITVSIRCMTHEFFFLGALMGWVFPALPAGCPAGTPAGPAIPAFATTLPSEDMSTIDN
jgi:hypothetical protein